MSKSLNKRSVIIEVLLHVAIWIIVFILPHYLLIYQEEDSPELYMFILKKTIFYIIIFYINYFLLIPYLFYRNRKLLYFISAVVVTFIVFVVSETVIENTRPKHPMMMEREMTERDIESNPPEMFQDGPGEGHKPPPRWPLAYNNLITFFLMTGAGLGLRFAKKIQETEQRRKEAEKEKLNTELVLLKSQIHPHFFFNTLNNIYALTEVKSPDASKAILKLSKLMRYVIYESETETTILSREIEFMNNYIDLMRLRLAGKVSLEVKFPDEYTDTEIQPLLFITFVENAFKHGISYSAPSFISIVMNVSSDNIEFICRNSIITPSEELKDDRPGLGLDNIKKRLTMLYPGKHKLIITNQNSVFEVNLKLFTGNENKNTGN